MRSSSSFWLVCLLASIQFHFAASQQIWDLWQTTWNRNNLFSSLKPSNPINFGSPGGPASAAISVNDGQVLQRIDGFGGSLTDSSAQLLNNLKNQNSGGYWSLLNYLFDPTDGANSAGLSYIRIPLGASDFSASTYNYDNVNGDTNFDNFNINKAPSYLFSVLSDIVGINNRIKIHLIPWSPPGWMKDSGTMNGGSLTNDNLDPYATYLLKSIQGFAGKGFRDRLYAISIQNEPQNSNPTYPTSTLTYQKEAQIGRRLRTLMDQNGYSDIKLIGYDHNWNNAGTYPVRLMDTAGDAFAGASFHCYSGQVSQQDNFHNAYPDKEIHFTECSGTLGSDWWEDIKWYLDNIFIGSIQHYSRSALMWNLVLDSSGEPRTPGTNSCGTGCRAIVSVDGSNWSVNQEFYAMAHLSKATIPKDSGGPFARRIGTSVSGDLNWALKVIGFVTERTSSTEWLRYSLVVLNWYDHPDGPWNPQNVQASISFRGQEARYSFPVGVTTLWWYAAAPGFDGNVETEPEQEPMMVYAESEGGQGAQQAFKWFAKDQ